MAPLTKSWCTVSFKNRKSWTFCYLLKLAISYFSDMWKLQDLPLHKRRIYRTLTIFSVLPFLLLPMAKCYMFGHNLTMTFPPDFHNYKALNKLVNSISNLPSLHQRNWGGCKPDWSTKRKKQHVRSGC